MATRSHVPEVRGPRRRVLSGVPDMRASCATHPSLPQIFPPQTPVDEVPPFTLLVLPGLQDREGRMTLVEGVFFFHRSSTPIARETFLSFPSNVFVPSLTSLLSLSVFCSGELVSFTSPFCFPQHSESVFCYFPFCFLSCLLRSALRPRSCELVTSPSDCLLLLLHMSFLSLLPQAFSPSH